MHRSNVGRESAIQRQARHGRFRRSKLRAAPRTTIHTAAMRGAATTGWGCACTVCTVGILAQGTHRAVVNAKRAFATAASATSSRVQSAATITAAVFGSRLGFGDLPGCRQFRWFVLKHFAEGMGFNRSGCCIASTVLAQDHLLWRCRTLCSGAHGPSPFCTSACRQGTIRCPNHNQACASRYRLNQSGYFLRGGLLASSHQQAWSQWRLECNRLPPIDALP